MFATVGIRTLVYRKSSIHSESLRCYLRTDTLCDRDEFASFEEVMLPLGLKRKSTGLYAEPRVASWIATGFFFEL